MYNNNNIIILIMIYIVHIILIHWRYMSVWPLGLKTDMRLKAQAPGGSKGKARVGLLNCGVGC